MSDAKMTATELISEAVARLAPVIKQDVVVSVMPEGNADHFVLSKTPVLSFEINRRDLCLMEMAMDAFQLMQHDAGHWACDPGHLRDAWIKLGNILTACELDYDDLKGQDREVNDD